MPQLSPLNWIFLYLLFWLIVFLVSILIWWSNKIDYTFFSKNYSCINNKWEWN